MANAFNNFFTTVTEKMSIQLIHTYIHSLNPQECHKTMGYGTCHNYKYI